VDRPLGRTSAVPIPFERLRAKFENCAARVLTPEAVAQAAELLSLADKNAGSVREFTALLAGVRG